MNNKENYGIFNNDLLSREKSSEIGALEGEVSTTELFRAAVNKVIIAGMVANIYNE